MGIYGDVFGAAQDALIKPAAGHDIAVHQTLRRKIGMVRDELAGPG
jgi:hypothetical protein